MINVLINAYACSPHWGSEPGMAWNWISCLAKHCNLFVITEGEWRKEIEEAVAVHPYRDHLHFYYNPVSDKIRRMCWNQGDWRFYWYYQKWQKKTLLIARQIVAENRIDILHQLNMIGFREPGYLWKIEGIPFVWGPIGGMELMPLSFLKGVSKSQYIKAWLKNLINDWQRKHHPRVLRAIHKASALIAATKGCADVIQGYHHQDVVLINETGCGKNDSPENLHNFHKTELELMWVGKFDSRKQLGLAIATMEQLKDIPVKMHIVRTGTEAESGYYRNMASQSGVDSKIVWHGLLPNQEVQGMMRKADLLLFTSIMEGTPHVVLEAVKNNLPVLCLKTCGQGEVVDSSIGYTIPLTNPNDCVHDFATQIRKLYDNRYLLQQMSDACYQKQIELSWDNKALRMIEAYKITPPIKADKDENTFTLLWVGKFDFRKQLGLAIRSVAATHNPNIQLHVCGTGRADEVTAFQTLAEKEGIGSQVSFHGKIPHDEMDTMMRRADLFFFTSIMETTSTVVLDAVSVGLPILSFNTCGFGPLVEEFAGEVIELSTPDRAVIEFAGKINELYGNPARLAEISLRELANKDRLSWDGKAREMVDIYKRILEC